MWIAFGIVLLALWALLKLVWGVASAAVHVVLAIALLAIVAHFVRGYFGRKGEAPSLA